MAQLHITNGDSAAAIIRASGIGGTVLAWRDPMHHGPFPPGRSLAQYARLRGRYLAGPDGDAARAIADFTARDAVLAASHEFDAVTLWFEHDLLDQLQLLQLLDWFAAHPAARRDLGLICIDRHPEVADFRGIGQLTPAQMARLWTQRIPVTDTARDLARAGWAAFCAPQPTALAAFLDTDTGALPFLAAALRRHCREYPDAATGLSRTEHQLLQLLADGITDPVAIFQANMERESALFIGDQPTFRTLAALCAAAPPLIATETGTPFWHPPGSRDRLAAFRAQRLRLTGTGRAIHDGTKTAFDAMHRDHWLGGVHIRTGGPLWTWDETAGTFAPRP